MAKSGGLLNSICARLTTTKVQQKGSNGDDMVAMETEQSEDTDKENNNEPYMDNKERDGKEIREIKEINKEINKGMEEENENKADEQTGRRNRRKNMKPMNIAQLDNYEEEEEEEDDGNYAQGVDEFDVAMESGEDDGCHGDELEEMEENGSMEENGGEEDCEENGQNGDSEILDLTSGMEKTADKSVYDDSQVDDAQEDGGVLDLSVTKNGHSQVDNGCHGDTMANGNQTDDLPDDDNDLEASAEDADQDTISNDKRDLPVDEAALKDYAQSTMSELLSMYGFAGEEVENITENVPMHNFSSGKILERQRLQSELPDVPRSRAHLKVVIGKKSHNPLVMAPKSLPESPITAIGSRSPAIGSRSPAIGSRSSSPLTAGSGASSPTNSMSNEAYSKLIEASSRLTSTPQGKSPSKFSLNLSSGSEGSPSKINAADYAQYMKRYFSYEQCKRDGCRDMLLKEHYHCTDCNYKVFMKKEDMIRHFKWHKKRAESLQYGFMRYSPTDDCSEKYNDCIHNRKQTHYHCLQRACDKVYISTSDVQMHANFHRKDSAIIQEGFQRFRATEDCKTPNCAFYGQRTTHFHCRRQGCSFTFKNKADMEKHKAYHQKDEILGKDGFKKFMKYEHCTFIGCRYSKVSNHIHCIRPGCDYVLHSTGQLYSHKRKHERRDFEHAYRRFKTTDTKPRSILPAVAHQQFISTFPKTQQQPTPTKPHALVLPNAPKQAIVTSNQNAEYIDLEDLSKMKKMDINFNNTQLTNATVTTTPSMTVEVNAALLDDDSSTKPPKSTLEKLASKISGTALGDSLTLPIPGNVKQEMVPLELTTDDAARNGNSGLPGAIPGFIPKTSPPINEKKERDESWKKYLTRYTANDPCHPRCQFLYKDHYHCNVSNCNMIFKSKDGVREHARYHDHQDRISSLSYKIVEADADCPVDGKCASKSQKHYHCLWPDCGSIITANDPPFSRLEHHKIHEYARVACGKGVRPTNPGSSQDHMKRRRGRPPKYPKNEIPMVPKITMSEEEIQKALRSDKSGMQASLASGFKRFSQAEPCPDYNCVFYLKEHYHCVRPRCHHSTDRVDVLNLHAKDFHNYITLLDGFEYFDPRIDCRRPHCHNNRANKHFHCTRPRCDYSFVRYSTMAQHDKKHKLTEMGKELSSPQLALPKSLAGLQQLGLSLPLALPGSPQANAMQQIIQHAALQSMGALRDNDGVIKTKGTYYPTSSQNKGNPGKTGIPKVNSSGLINIAPKPASERGMALPLTMLLQQKAMNTVPQMDWLTLCMRMHYGQMQNCGRPFCKLKKKEHYHCFDCSQAFSDPDRLKMHVAKHGIRLEKVGGSSTPTEEHGAKRRAEEPLNEGLDLTIKKRKQDECKQESQDDEIDPSSSLNLNPSTFSNLLNPNYLGKHNPHLGEDGESEDEGALVMDFSKQEEEEEDDDDVDDDDDKVNESAEDELDQQLHHPAWVRRPEEAESLATNDGESNGSHNQENGGNEMNGASESKAADSVQSTNQDVFDIPEVQVSFSRHSGRKRTAPKHDDFINSDSIVAKQRKVSSSSVESNVPFKSPPKESKEPKETKDENLPEGYTKFKFTEDCEHERCAYRLTNTHYHCTRAECGFSFSDRSRLPQHQQRHERYDSLMGEDFTQHRLHQTCEQQGCEFSKKASHFHCQRCEFACTDSSKVMAHRKQHEKLDNIASLGFERVLGTSECVVSGCVYGKKQTHYHCLVEGCQQAVLGPSMMQAHQQRHNSPA